ncbi:DgyrCDS5405 [Dimorphilus gyrociliatus]|uniref:DgyrCDS5405 n=1 Tax=Dimorphilus gyrociliatus TaxID=2664684 RepID=A0A7I8VKG5_9ANNE|nr:DgyrCDS5405 [Dimorphilus gyrociliatus]
MVKRKFADNDDAEGDQTIPIPIQTFLWRQTSPFFRLKLGKLCEASCVSFERVLVQNILHGLSPSLCEALQSVDRWKVIQAALPHVMHCCSVLIRKRKESSPGCKFGPNEIKLLYTLHWILLDAASECEEGTTGGAGTGTGDIYLGDEQTASSPEKQKEKEKNLRNYLHSLETIQLFIYFFGPLLSSIREEDFQSLKLENGLRLWIPLWEHRQPDIPCFSMPVKPRRSQARVHKDFVRKEPFSTKQRRDLDMKDFEIERDEEVKVEVEEMKDNNQKEEEQEESAAQSPPVKAADTQTAVVEVICEVCNEIIYGKHGETECKCSQTEKKRKCTLTKVESVTQSPKSSNIDSSKIISDRVDVLSASYMDVAVLRCLFCSQWQEEGVYWCLKYVHRRLLEVIDEISSFELIRERSKSLPNPDTKSSIIDDLTVISSRRDSLILHPSIEKGVTKKESSFKRSRMQDFKQLLDDKMKKLIRRQSCEQFEGDENISGRCTPDYQAGSLTKLCEQEELTENDSLSSASSSTQLVRRKSMPSIVVDPSQATSVTINNSANDSACRTGSLKPDLTGQNPIITITEDSPEPSPSYQSSWKSVKRESLISARSVNPEQRLLRAQRSLTDSNISYLSTEEVQEVAGCVYYTDSNGHLDYAVVLKAAYIVSSRDCSARVCLALLNIVDCLLDLGIIEKEEKNDEKSKRGNDNNNNNNPNSVKETDSKADQKEKDGCFFMAMETMCRIYRCLGCPYGCNEAIRGNIGDKLRSHALNGLDRLRNINPSSFSTFITKTLVDQQLQSTMNFLHALLGFCSEGEDKKSRKTSSSESNKTGYSSNFGEDQGKERKADSFIVLIILKKLISKFVDSSKEIHSQDNINLYCDVRQFVCHVKETHGSTFRKVALSGLVDAVDRRKLGEEKMPPTVIKRTMSMNSDNAEDGQKTLSFCSLDESGSGSRRSLFRKKTRKQALTNAQGAASDSETLDEQRTGKLSPRVSVSGEGEEPSSGPTTPKRKFSKFALSAWKKSGTGARSDHEDDQSDYESRRESKSSPSSDTFRSKSKMSFKAAGQATLTFLSARKRIEDGLRSWSKRRMSKRDSMDDESSQRESLLVNNAMTSEVILLKEKRLVNSYAVKSGMLRFNLMLDCCLPGTVPDAHLMAALLDLEAPIVARATLFLECAYFINKCNKGEWPNWMKRNLPQLARRSFHNRNQPTGYKYTLLLQRNAAKMFHLWGEAIANRMWYILNEEANDNFAFGQQVKDEKVKKELRVEDDEEDFLDEATVNHSGSDCPYALKMVACQLLLEITTFLRETFQYLPKVKPVKVPSVRRSSGLNSPPHSDRSNSRSSQGDLGLMVNSPSDRKISFAVRGRSEEKSDSLHSSTTSLAMPEAEKNKKSSNKSKLLKMRRGSGHNSSLKRSFKVKRETGSLRRVGSIRCARKVSTQSLKSEKSDDDHSADDENTQGASANTEADETTVEDELDLSKCMPWIKVVIRLANNSNFICEHQQFCHTNCYERQRRSCVRLLNAARKVYDSTPESMMQNDDNHENKREKFKDKMKRRESMFQPSSPKRRESTPLLDKIRTDVNFARAKIASVLEKKQKKVSNVKDEAKIVKYLRAQVQNLTQAPLAIICKSAPILSEENFIDMLPVAWELLLESDQELVAASASLFILSSIKVGDHVQELMIKELQHQDTNQRINAVLRFHVLWKFRHQVWPRMEDGSNMFFKVPPPSIDFVQPSPTIGLPCLNVIDPPWLPHFKTKVEEVTLNEEETKTFVTATTTRRKQQQEMLNRALIAEEDRRKSARENFHVTSVPVNYLAAYEPALHHGDTNEYDDATPVPEELTVAAARRMSVAPTSSMVNRTSTAPIGRNPSWRQGSVLQWGRPTIFEAEEDRVEHPHSQHMQLCQAFFPSFVCAAALPIIHLLDDLDVGSDGISVSQVAEKVVWYCLVEDTPLFLRTFLEKITHRDKQEELIFLLRKLLFHLQSIPAQSAHNVFNYLVGFIMFYVRSPAEGGNEAIARALSFLWQLVPSVHGVCFRDLKQTLRKEQCETTLLITAIVPSAKKLIVHGPDLSSIPSQYPIDEDTQFHQILSDSLEFFSIAQEQHNEYFLMDAKTHQIHHGDAYVRDFYFFRRNMYPQLSLVHMQPNDAFNTLQMHAASLKAAELGKVLFTMAVLQTHSQQQLVSSVSFLQEELLKLPTFPRKALESDLSLHRGKLGKELYGLDMMHKYAWARLIQVLFMSMSTTVTADGDLPLFLNVINGTLLLHCEDTAMLRCCLATYLNASRHFKQVFSINGFFFIMPSILQVYTSSRPNCAVRQAIEFACRSFYTMHRKPFMLQTFGSLAPLLDMDKSSADVHVSKIDPKCLFELLLSLETDCPDVLEILDLVNGSLPLSALDLCYTEDPDAFQMIDSINMCVTVVAYAPDSPRSMQMLTVLEALLPQYLNHLAKQTDKLDSVTAAKEEVTAISNLAVSVKALVMSCEPFTRNFSAPQRHLETVNTSVKLTHNHNHHHRPSIYPDELSDIRFTAVLMEEGRGSVPNRQGPGRTGRYAVHSEDDIEASILAFRKPRNCLLVIVTHFYVECHKRLKILRKIVADPSFRIPQLLDPKTHNRLGEVAHTLLKIAPYNSATMSCPGLQRYTTDILPITDWSLESNRPALNLILRRMDRLFYKIYKKPALRRNMDWDAAGNLLKGLYDTLIHFKYVAVVGNLKNLISACINIILADESSSIPANEISSNASKMDSFPRIITPPYFCSAAIKLTAMQMQALGDQFSLAQICGNITVFSPEKTTNMLVNLILPLCIRMGCGRRDSPKMRNSDISFALTILLHALVPPHKQQSSSVSGANRSQHFGVGDMSRTSGTAYPAKKEKETIKEGTLEIIFLGLRIMIVCYEKELSNHWFEMAKTISAICTKTGGLAVWRFIDFIVSYKTALTILMQPFIQYRMMKMICDSGDEYYIQQAVHQKLQGEGSVVPKSKGTILIDLAMQLKQIKLELSSSGDFRPRTTTIVSNQSAVSKSASMLDLLEQQAPAETSSTNQVVSPRFLTPQSSFGGGTATASNASNNGNVPKSVESLVNMKSNPAIKAKANNRIKATDGHAILEHFFMVNADEDGDGEGVDDASNGEQRVNTDPVMHRLQRADARSRKTFKVKRNKSTIKGTNWISGSIMRSATVKGPLQMRSMPTTELTSADKVLDETPTEKEKARTRFVPKSKSQEDSAQSSSGVRGRIARQKQHSAKKSPPESPLLQSAPSVDSFDSSSSQQETTALLNSSERRDSESSGSLLIYFDGNDVPDTCV